MTLTTHALVGAAAASIFPHHPYVAFAAGFASHLAIDSIPHWDYARWLTSVDKDPGNPLNNDMRWGWGFAHDLAIIATDAVLGTILAVVLLGWAGVSVPIALVGAWAGVLPDFLQFVFYKTRGTLLGFVLMPLQELHIRLQMGKHRNWWPLWQGLGSQLVLVGVVVGLAALAG